MGLETKLVNNTGQNISFVVSNNGVCPLRDLPAGRSRSVSLSRILKCCRERGSAEWPIRVLINGRFYGMHLHPHRHILKMTRIVFRYKWRSDGSCVLIVEGVEETFSNRIFGCCINWQKRNYVEIAEADSTWRSIRSSQDPNIVGTLQSNLQIREVGVGGPDTVAAPLIGGGGRSIPASVINSSAAVESRKRLYRLLSLRRRVMFNRFLLFGLAFILVASLHLFRIARVMSVTEKRCWQL